MILNIILISLSFLKQFPYKNLLLKTSNILSNFNEKVNMNMELKILNDKLKDLKEDLK